MPEVPLIAIATAAEVAELDDEGQQLADALREHGVQVDPAIWNDTAIDWTAYDLVVVRSTWDYAKQCDTFLHWAERVEATTRLANDAALLTWNTDKRYLHDLQRAGVPVVPSQFIEPGEDASHDWLHSEHVVKPSVSAGSKDTLRLGAEESARSIDHVSEILDGGRTALVQPYLAEIDTAGETAMLFFDGEFSHAICKGAILKRGAGLVEGLFAPEVITPRTPSDSELQLAQAAMAALPAAQPPLYARVDAIPSADGPVILEVELTEPSMFLEHAQGSSGRFADAIIGRLR